MERAENFYGELKQLNEDLSNYIKESNAKSPYFDFSPTFKDYMDQLSDLNKKYPPVKEPPLFQPTPTSIGGGGGGGIPSAQPFQFSFSMAKKDDNAAKDALPPPEPKVDKQEEPNAKPPYFDFTPTFKDQLSDLNKKLTPVKEPLFQSTPALISAGSIPSAQPFQFSFGMAKKDEDDAEDAPPPEPKIDKYEEPNVKHSVKCKLYEKGKMVGGEVPVSLLGVGFLYVKDMDTPNKLQVIFRQEPDLRRVLLNEVVTSSTPVKTLPKAVQMVFPSEEKGGFKFIIAKFKDETEVKNLLEILTFANK